MEYSAKARLPLQLWQYHLSFALLITISIGMTFQSYPLITKWEKIGPKGGNSKGSQDSSLLAINAK
jgi:hypothetical protein